MFSARQAATLLIGAEFTKLQPDASLQTDADAVAMKIRSVLPEPVRDYIDRLQERTVLAPFNEADRGGATGDEQGLWFELSEAVARQRKVKMTYYVASRDEETVREVDPLGLVYYSDHWNLIAYDHLRDDIRNFRLDQIKKLRTRFDGFEPPPGFDLKEHLRERGSTPENVRMTVRFKNRAVALGAAPAARRRRAGAAGGQGLDRGHVRVRERGLRGQVGCCATAPMSRWSVRRRCATRSRARPRPSPRATASAVPLPRWRAASGRRV